MALVKRRWRNSSEIFEQDSAGQRTLNCCVIRLQVDPKTDTNVWPKKKQNDRKDRSRVDGTEGGRRRRWMSGQKKVQQTYERCRKGSEVGQLDCRTAPGKPRTRKRCSSGATVKVGRSQLGTKREVAADAHPGCKERAKAKSEKEKGVDRRENRTECGAADSGKEAEGTKQPANPLSRDLSYLTRKLWEEL